MKLNLDAMPPTDELEKHLSTLVRRVEYTYPTVKIDDWDVYYSPDSASYGDVLRTWTARQSSRFYESPTLEHLIEALKRDADV